MRRYVLPISECRVSPIQGPCQDEQFEAHLNFASLYSSGGCAGSGPVGCVDSSESMRREVTMQSGLNLCSGRFNQ